MKNFLILLVAIFSIACHRGMTSWPSEEAGEEVAIYVRSRSMSATLASDYQLFIVDKTSGKVSKHSITSETGTSNPLRLKLPVGTYTGYCITYASDENLWEYKEDAQPEQIFLKASADMHGEAKDYLLGTCDFEVQEDVGSSAVFDLNRKVGMLKVTIENIPDWLTDLQINLSEIPLKMNLKGEYDMTYTVIKNVTPPVDGSSETTLLVFPPASTQKASLTLTSVKSHFASPSHPIDSIKANQITEIKAIFQKTSENMQIDFTTNFAQWEEEIIQEEDWPIDLPDSTGTGSDPVSGDGTNLVVNGDFEEGTSGGIPKNWKLDASDKKYIKKAIIVTSPVQHGQNAVMTEGKTYIYQDVPVVGGRTYQLNLYVYAPALDAKWKYWGTWMKGSSALTANLSNSIRSANYEKQNSEYVDVYQGKFFRAPAEATQLRIEVRNYGEQGGNGIYIDNASVQAVN